MTRTKVAVIRESGHPVGQPAPLFLACPCGAKPPTNGAMLGGKVKCKCGVIYTSDGWVFAAAAPAVAWHVDLRNQDGPFVLDENGSTICEVYPQEGDEGKVSLANAHLIAAAPDMLSNLQYVVTCAEGIRNDFEDGLAVSITITARGLRDIRALVAALEDTP